MTESENLKKRPEADKHWLTWVLFLAVIAGILIAGALIDEADIAADFLQKNQPPSMKYPFGTDWLGRNMMLRTIKGMYYSIRLGMVSTLVSAVFAVIIGVIAAMGSKRADGAVKWVIDLVMGIPHIVLLILISFACGRGETGLFAGIVLTHWTSLARLVRAEVLQIRSQNYIKISKSLGHSRAWILKEHILPHIVPQFIVGMVVMFPHAVLHESALSFLGYGLPPEQPAIGIILSESMKYLSSGMWWLAIFPGIMLALVVLMFDRLGESLTDKGN